METRSGSLSLTERDGYQDGDLSREGTFVFYSARVRMGIWAFSFDLHSADRAAPRPPLPNAGLGWLAAYSSPSDPYLVPSSALM